MCASSRVEHKTQMTHLRVHSISVFVADVYASADFYVRQLGFRTVFEHQFESGVRVVGVTPPDGPTILVLTAPAPGSEELALVGKSRDVALIAEDIHGTYLRWSEAGVRFKNAPDPIESLGRYAVFEDIDGNRITLLGFDATTRALEAERRAEAERVEAERRTAQEFEYAKQVQARLFPQVLPAVAGLDCAGECLQARHVGGDYYDYLSLGQERVGLVIADVSGKGMPAALLMANLQANLRSQLSMAADEPERLLRSVNRLFYESTTPSAYATLLFATLDAATGHFQYVNCGHLPGLVLRRNGSVERLCATSTVVGMFPAFDCRRGESHLEPGDMLALYTDGVTEAGSGTGDDEFGEDRLVDALRRQRNEPAASMVNSIVREPMDYGGSAQHDDITLLIAKR